MQPPSEQRAFSHFILMRFNVRSKHVAEPRDAAIRARKDWLDTRFKLFEEFCWPTLIAQSCKDFHLYVFFDQQTPSEYLRRFDTIIKGTDFVKVVLCEYFDIEIALHAILTFQPQYSWILTTRLDNDDGLHRDFVKTLQNVIRTGTTEAINFPRGLVVANGAIYESHQRSNAFISLLEPYAQCRSVMQRSHNEIDRCFAIRDVITQPMWFQHVHGGNVSNKIRGRRIPSRSLPPGFDNLGLAEQIKPISPLEAWIENATLGILRSGRDRLATTARRLRPR